MFRGDHKHNVNFDTIKRRDLGFKSEYPWFQAVVYA